MYGLVHCVSKVSLFIMVFKAIIGMDRRTKLNGKRGDFVHPFFHTEIRVFENIFEDIQGFWVWLFFISMLMVESLFINL